MQRQRGSSVTPPPAPRTIAQIQLEYNQLQLELIQAQRRVEQGEQEQGDTRILVTNSPSPSVYSHYYYSDYYYY